MNRASITPAIPATVLLLIFLLQPATAQASGTLNLPEGITDTGQWMQMSGDAGWQTRGQSGAVALSDGTIVIAGGGWEYAGIRNDVWKSDDYGVSWTRLIEHAGWPARSHHSMNVMTDGSIVLMGGWDGSTKTFMNDVWRSSDGGKTWTCMTGDAGWSPRFGHTSVVLSDGSIVLMGGLGSEGRLNDVWRSSDYGATWTRVDRSQSWTPRYVHCSVAMPDDSIILMGGSDASGSFANDVWRSADRGSTWTEIMASAAWSGRQHQSCAVLDDSRIVLMGGYGSGTLLNDVWQSDDAGMNWARISGFTPWSPRYGQASVEMPDGSLILIGGVLGGATGTPGNYGNDVWRWIPPTNPAQDRPAEVLVTKQIRPDSLKQGTNATIEITVINNAKTPIHDVEILDTTLPEFLVQSGELQYATSLLEPNETRILSYTILATTPGSYQLNRTQVMYADTTGNYTIAYSNNPRVVVLAPLFPPAEKNSGDPIRIFFGWLGFR